MLNPFPIQYLALTAHFILRIAVASILIYLGLLHVRHRREIVAAFTNRWFQWGGLAALLLIATELTIGAFLLVGAHTQYAALGLMALSVDQIIARRWFTHRTLPSRLMYTMLFFCGLSLFITGAGILAVDLPL